MNTYDSSPPAVVPETLSAGTLAYAQSSELGGCGDRGRNAPEGAPAPGGAAAPFLDIGCGNVPRKEGLSAWSRKQWVTRRTVLDRLNHWQANGYQCLWVTLTSSPSSPLDQLRRDFQTLRKRMARQLGYEGVQYVCVDTREGFGVLHIILAWKEAEA